MIERLKFRGKVKTKKSVEMNGYTLVPNTWLTTDLIAGGDHQGTMVEKIHEFWHLVDDGWIDENTVGQWTGLKDSKEQEIWEGDIVEHEDTYGDNPPEFSKFEVKFAGGSFYLSYMGDEGDDYNCDILIQPITIIGTIHDKEQA